MRKNCSICGEPSGMYPLCTKCFKLRDEGKIIKCIQCGKWHYTDNPCSCLEEKIFNDAKTQNEMENKKPIKKNEEKENREEIKINSTNKCIVCSKESGNNIQCIECWKQTEEFEDELNKNSQPFELKDYYYNLKSNIYRIYDFEKVKINCNKLLAIANLLNKTYKDSSLSNRVINDIRDIIIAKDPKEIEQVITEYTKKKDDEKQDIIRTIDGHRVKSNAEEIIDNIIYNRGYVHCYGKKVTEIPKTERTVECDWYIPVLQNKGIYIEYWGMETRAYIENKEEKRALYKKYNVPLIEIEKDDIKHDSQGLQDRIDLEIRELKDKILKTF